MSLNVNYTSLYKNGIDTSVLKEVSNEILQRAAQKSAQYAPSVSAATNTTNHVNSIPKSVELGVDLYQGKIDVNTQKQIAINNALQYQFNEQTVKSIQYLNSQAALASRVDGKYMPTVNATVTESQKAAEVNPASHFMSIFAAATAKDKEGSNPFYHGELLNKSKKDEQEQVQRDSLKSLFI